MEIQPQGLRGEAVAVEVQTQMVVGQELLDKVPLVAPHHGMVVAIHEVAVAEGQAKQAEHIMVDMVLPLLCWE